MADAKLTALTAASALAGADLFYISQGGVSKKATHTQLLTLVGTTYVPLAGGTMTGALRISTLYTDASNYERLTLTGVAGTSVNITAETLGTGGDNIDIVLTPAGAGSVVFPNATYINSTGFGILSGIKCGTESSLNYYASGLRIFSIGEVAWTNTTAVNAAVDTALMRNAAGIVEVNNGTAGTYRDLKLRNLLSTGYAQIDSGTLTASAPALNITQTWNNAGVTFNALFIDVTDSASDATSYLQSWSLNGSAVAYMTKIGNLALLDINAYGNILTLTNGGYYGLGASSDVRLYRDAPATLAQRNGTTQQIFRLYNTYTDSSNYERLTLTGVAGTSVNLTAETLGTGADNLSIVLTPAGTGRTRFEGTAHATVGMIFGSSTSAVGVAINYFNYGMRISSTGELGWTAGAIDGTFDTAFLRGAAGQVDVTNGTAATYRDLKLRNLLNTEYHQMTEMTAPSAPSTNSVRIYAEDNGAGKTRLMALFATGAAVQLGIEP